MEENIFNTEIGKKILALTKASFKVSDLISDLVLREKIKNQVLEVYKTFFLMRYDLISARSYLEGTNLLREIDILDYYFCLGGHLNLVKEEHLKQLQNGFLVFKSCIILLNNNTSDTNKNTRMMQIAKTKFPLVKNVSSSENVENSVSKIENLNAKQKKILEKFENKDTLRLSEIMENFSNISERTVRNELSALVNLGKITRSGMGSGSFYKIAK